MNDKRPGWGGPLTMVLIVCAAIAFAAAVIAGPLWQREAGASGPVERLYECESGGDYQINTGNGYYGAAQWLPATWDATAAFAGEHGWVGVRPDLAPPQVQDRMMLTLLYDVPWGGWQHWPVCGRNVRGISPASAQAELTPPPNQGHYGRRTDTHLLCEVDGLPGEERVVVRLNRWFVDLDHRGGEGEYVIGFGAASDSPACVDLDGDGIDEPVVHRDSGGFWRRTWTTGPGIALDPVQCAATGCS